MERTKESIAPPKRDKYGNLINKRYWFRKRSWSSSWYPITWEGWLVTALYMITVIVVGVIMDEKIASEPQLFVTLVIILIVSLVGIVIKKGEPIKSPHSKKKK